MVRLLKSGQELQVFRLRKEEYAAFKPQARQYKLLYAALRNRWDPDGRMRSRASTMCWSGWGTGACSRGRILKKRTSVVAKLERCRGQAEALGRERRQPW